MYSFNLLLIRFALLTISGICLRVCHCGDSSLLAHAAVLGCCFPIDCSCLQFAAYDSGVTQFTHVWVALFLENITTVHSYRLTRCVIAVLYIGSELRAHSLSWLHACDSNLCFGTAT